MESTVSGYLYTKPLAYKNKKVEKGKNKIENQKSNWKDLAQNELNEFGVSREMNSSIEFSVFYSILNEWMLWSNEKAVEPI